MAERTRIEAVRGSVQSLISLCIAVWMIVAYAIWGRNYCETPVPIYLLVTGISQIVLMLVTLFITFCLPPGAVSSVAADRSKATAKTCVLFCFLLIIILFSISWWIVGQVWTFGISVEVCDPVIYYTAFWYLIIVYILIGLACVIGTIYRIATNCCCKA